MTPWQIAALYIFVPLDNVSATARQLEAICAPAGVCGTLLVASEGVNGTLAAPPAVLKTTLEGIRALPGFGDLEVKISHASTAPFHRMKVRIKREIVTMGIDGVDAARDAGMYVVPEDWNSLITDEDVLLIDTRNDYEVAIGSFDGALDPGTTSFREFPAWVEANRARLDAAGKIAMFCTGGIRCEKSTAYLKTLGYTDVYHLKGGILNYLEQIPARDSRWRGDCFVFDERVAVGHGLKTSTIGLCRACRRPVDRAARAHPDYEEGVSCARCINEYSDARRSRFRERQRQVEYAARTGATHIGQDLQAAKSRKKLP